MSGRFRWDPKRAERAGDFARQTVELPRPTKRIISICTDAVMMPAGALGRPQSQGRLSRILTSPIGPPIVAVVAVSIPIFVRLGLYRAVIRFLGHKAVFAVAFAVALSGVLLGLVGHAASRSRRSRWSVVAIYSCLALLYVAGFALRGALLPAAPATSSRRWRGWRSTARARPARRLSTVLSTTRAFDPLVFIDDNKSLHGRMVNGIKVYRPEQLAGARSRTASIDRVLLALPSLTRRRRREILSALEPLGVHVQTVPEFEQLVTGNATVGDIREVDVCDLLGTRFGAAEGRSVRRLHPRPGGHGHRRRRFHRLGTMPTNHRA